MGYAVVRLDTGPKQPDAQRMYERAGYVAVPDYNGNPYASFWGEKALGRAAGTDPPAVRGAGAGADASAGDGRP